MCACTVLVRGSVVLFRGYWYKWGLVMWGYRCLRVVLVVLWTAVVVIVGH